MGRECLLCRATSTSSWVKSLISPDVFYCKACSFRHDAQTTTKLKSTIPTPDEAKENAWSDIQSSADGSRNISDSEMDELTGSTSKSEPSPIHLFNIPSHVSKKGKGVMTGLGKKKRIPTTKRSRMGKEVSTFSTPGTYSSSPVTSSSAVASSSAAASSSASNKTNNAKKMSKILMNKP